MRTSCCASRRPCAKERITALVNENRRMRETSAIIADAVERLGDRREGQLQELNDQHLLDSARNHELTAP